MRPKYTPLFIARFWARVERGGPDECWLWTGAAGRYGHGHVSYRDGKKSCKVGAYVVAWELLRAPVPAGLWVLHNCPGGDNPRCVNPAHLFIGTAKDNSQDMVKKGRSAAGDRHWARRMPELIKHGDNHPSHLHPERLRRGDNHPARTNPERMARGSANGNARLDEQKVVQIRQMHAAGVDRDEIAAAFGVHRDTIRNIINGKGWRHVA